MSRERTPEQKARSAENMRRYRAESAAAGFKPPPLTDEQKRKQAGAQARHRAKKKAAGFKRETTEAEKKRQREYVAERRAAAKAAGIELPSDTWWKENPEKHRARTRKWRSDNLDYSRAVTRIKQEERRSTPWGRITNNMVALMHHAVRRGRGQSKYLEYLGYTWADLRAHLEAQFTPAMCWENWGDVWELDHIKPLSSFRYESLEDPLFRECWALSNLRPLPREENASKGAKPA